MDDIIKRLEAATAPSRVLDGLIFRVVYERPGDVWTDMFDEPGGVVWHRRDPEDHVAYDPPPHFTSSIDEALKLVPESFYWSFDSRGCGIVSEEIGVDRVGHCLGHVSPAIALCIAALKARGAQ